MKSRNVVFIVFLMMSLVSAYQFFANTTSGEKNQKIYGDGDFSLITVADSEYKRVFVKVDKGLDGYDGEKNTTKFLNSGKEYVNILNSQQKFFSIRIAEILKFQLFLLYSSLKLDC